MYKRVVASIVAALILAFGPASPAFAGTVVGAGNFNCWSGNCSIVTDNGNTSIRLQGGAAAYTWGFDFWLQTHPGQFILVCAKIRSANGGSVSVAVFSDAWAKTLPSTSSTSYVTKCDAVYNPSGAHGRVWVQQATGSGAVFVRNVCLDAAFGSCP